MTESKYDEFFKNSELIENLIKSDLDPRNPLILDKVVEHYIDIVGESSNVKILFLAFISRNLPRELRMHVADFSRSGAGKSYLIRNIAKPFGKDLITITSFTEAWLKYKMQALDRKILFWQQVNKQDEEGKGTTGSLKIAITDEGINFGYAVRDEKTGRYKSEELASTSLPVVVTTTTRALNDEDQRRYILLSNDESDKQTVSIITHALAKSQSIAFKNKIEKARNELKYLIEFYDYMGSKIYDVIIPFGAKLGEQIPKNFAMRTDISKVIQLIKIIAFAHIVNRKIVNISCYKEVLSDQWANTENKKFGQWYLIAEASDVDEAMRIARRIFTQTNYRLPDGSLRLLDKTKSYYNADGTETDDKAMPTIKDLTRDMDVSRKTIYTWLEPLADLGFITKFRLEGDKQMHVKLLDKAVNPFPEIIVSFDENDFMQWFESEFKDNPDANIIRPIDHLDNSNGVDTTE